MAEVNRGTRPEPGGRAVEVAATAGGRCCGAQPGAVDRTEAGVSGPSEWTLGSPARTSRGGPTEATRERIEHRVVQPCL